MPPGSSLNAGDPLVYVFDEDDRRTYQRFLEWSAGRFKLAVIESAAPHSIEEVFRWTEARWPGARRVRLDGHPLPWQAIKAACPTPAADTVLLLSGIEAADSPKRVVAALNVMRDEAVAAWPVPWVLAVNRVSSLLLQDATPDFTQFVTVWLRARPPRHPAAPELPPRPARRTVFLAYAREDARWAERLRVHLAPLERAGRVEIWDDTRIAPGANWRQAIDSALEEAAAAVLLVSPDFLASDFIQDREVPALLERAGRGGLRLFPVLVRPCFISGALSTLQLVDAHDRALVGLLPAAAEELLVRLTRQIASATAVQAEESGGEEPATKEPTIVAHPDRMELVDVLAQRFTQSEREVLLFHLGLRADDVKLRPESAADFALAMVLYVESRGRLAALWDLVERQRPHLMRPRRNPFRDPLDDRARECLREMRMELARLYPAARDAQRLAFDSGLRQDPIDFSGSPANLWFALLEHARASSAIEHVLRAALAEHPGNQQLHRLLIEWQALGSP